MNELNQEGGRRKKKKKKRARERGRTGQRAPTTPCPGDRTGTTVPLGANSTQGHTALAKKRRYEPLPEEDLS